nr:retrovirus-related Pol polyprotein from transposon TNT 1-94 [Tanacetum cinerariifolium]
MYCLVVIDDYSRFTWVFFLDTKDETSVILKSFITRIENLVDHKVKVIRYDNETEFKNREMNQFCEMKGILRQFSVARNPQQNRVAKKRNRILIEAAKTMLADFNKAFRVFNSRKRIVEVNLHIRFSERTPNIIDPKISHDDGSKPSCDDGKKVDEEHRKEIKYNELPIYLNMPALEDVSVFNFLSDDEDDGTKWVFRNKKDEKGIMIRNKARLVDQGYTQEEKINYDEVFAHVARIKAIRLFLAYASFKDFVVYQMDVKNAFLYGEIEEEVYVCQPPGFEDPYFLDRVYKVKKAMYGLHQALKALYETLSTYLLENRFQRQKIDKTLFIKRHKGDILLVKVYLDDIILGSTKKELCNAFESQDKYVAKILKKFGFIEVKTASTPMETQKPLLKDEDGEDVDVHMHRSMIGSLMYLTSSRPDIMFAVCACARYQVNPKVSYLYAVKRIFRASLDMKSITGGCQFLGCRLISWQCKKQIVVVNSIIDTEYTMVIQNQFELNEGSAMPTDPYHTPTILQPSSSQPQKTQKSRKPKRKDNQVPQPSGPTKSVTDKAVHKELGDSLMRVATTASSLEAEQNSGNTLRSDLDRIKLDELMALCTTLQNKGRRINAIDADEDITLVNDANNKMFDVDDLSGDEVFVAGKDLEDLYKLVKARYGSTRPVDNMDYLLQSDIKTMFEPHVEDEIYMLVENTYPLTPPTLSMMLEKKLQIDYESELNRFKRLDVWELVPLPKGRHAIKMDVKTAFLRGPFKVEVFVSQPDGFIYPYFPNHVYRLKKALHGPKQSLRACMIGGLMYPTTSQPDIAFATYVCACYQAHPSEKYLKEVKMIFQYLWQSINKGFWYSKDSGFKLIEYSDANLVGCLDDYKSTSGGLQFLGDKLVSWSSKKQVCTAMSTAKAEYVSLSTYYAQVIWMRTQLLDYGYRYNKIPM